MSKRHLLLRLDVYYEREAPDLGEPEDETDTGSRTE
jgi:hypothetical protein